MSKLLIGITRTFWQPSFFTDIWKWQNVICVCEKVASFWVFFFWEMSKNPPSRYWPQISTSLSLTSLYWFMRVGVDIYSEHKYCPRFPAKKLFCYLSKNQNIEQMEGNKNEYRIVFPSEKPLAAGPKKGYVWKINKLLNSIYFSC